MLSRRLKRWISITVLGMLAFSQANIVLAACQMERADMAQMLSSPAGDSSPCDDAAPGPGGMAMSANACVSHCTSDLQAHGLPFPFVPAAVAVPVLLLPHYAPAGQISANPVAALPAAVPPRILLHSFLI